MTQVSIIKSNGQAEDFEPAKLRHSLQRSGATVGQAEAIVHTILDKISNGDTTRSIYRQAFSLLKNASATTASRYSLKQAMLQLGPTGYPFEKLVGEILRAEGHDVKTGQTLQGRWVTHEVDVVAGRDGNQLLIECKFHNQPSRVSDVKVALYVNSRFQDIHTEWERTPEPFPNFMQGGIFTNTRFSVDAMQYGKGVGMRMVSWNFPYEENLPQLLERYRIYPLTMLTALTAIQHQALLAKGVVLCSDLKADSSSIASLNLDKRQGVLLSKELEELGL